MNFLVDESVDGPIVDALRVVGHQILYIAEIEPGIQDDQVLSLANANQSILMTEDKDFGELVYRDGRANHGVLLLRLAGLSTSLKIQQVTSAIDAHRSELEGAFAVLSTSGLRIRKK